VVSKEVLECVDTLQLEYARALDRADMIGWETCFADKASYICLTRESEEQSLPIALMLDDTRERIADRVKYVTRVWAGTFEDYRTRHFVQRMQCAESAPSLYAVESQFMVAYTSARGQSELLVVGVYVDEVIIEGDRARFRSRKAVLDTVVTPRYLVYPV
jgi:anthranilate 1,2-dioxygenase small subunit